MSKWQPVAGGGYTSDPTRVRILSDGSEWFLDGADDFGNYTEQVWSYDTFAEALAEVHDFVMNTATYGGVVWRWNRDRPRGFRRGKVQGMKLTLGPVDPPKKEQST